MNIAVIGTGHIGRTLGTAWAKAGHEVSYGVRDTSSANARAAVEEARDAKGSVRLTGIEQAADFGDVILFAVPARALPSVLSTVRTHLENRVLIDATNNVGAQTMHSLEALRDAGGHQAVYARAFSNLGYENFAHPQIGGEQIDLIYCADAGPATEKGSGLADLISDVGLRPVWLGDSRKADLIDALTRVWFSLALEQGRGRRIALKLLQKSETE